jgi:hypothetical protein
VCHSTSLPFPVRCQANAVARAHSTHTGLRTLHSDGTFLNQYRSGHDVDPIIGKTSASHVLPAYATVLCSCLGHDPSTNLVLQRDELGAWITEAYQNRTKFDSDDVGVVTALFEALKARQKIIRATTMAKRRPKLNFVCTNNISIRAWLTCCRSNSLV